MDGLFDFSDFLNGNQCELPIIWAVGSNSVELDNHGSNRGSVTLWSCMCTEDPTKSPSTIPTAGEVMSTDSIDNIWSDGANYVQWSFG
eukprot:410001_1